MARCWVLSQRFKQDLSLLNFCNPNHKVVGISKAGARQAFVLLVIEGDSFASGRTDLLSNGFISNREKKFFCNHYRYQFFERLVV